MSRAEQVVIDKEETIEKPKKSKKYSVIEEAVKFHLRSSTYSSSTTPLRAHSARLVKCIQKIFTFCKKRKLSGNWFLSRAALHILPFCSLRTHSTAEFIPLTKAIVTNHVKRKAFVLRNSLPSKMIPCQLSTQQQGS